MLLVANSVLAQVSKTEPPFWFAGMHNPKLQIMFYGPNIAQNTVSVSNQIVISNVQKTENPNYLFVTIDTKNLLAQELVFSFSKNDKTVFTQNYSLKSRRADAALRKSFDASDMVYLLMPDRFANGNPNNDSHATLAEKADRSNPGGRHGGDIQGVIQHLDYLQELGVTTLWPTPLCEDNDKTYSYHTYGQSDVYKIDPRYGSNEEYLQLSTELHKRNMKLVMDYVTNHWGAAHWMIQDLPTYDWIHQFPGYSQSNYRMTTQYDNHAAKIDTKNCVEGWFVPSMPDLNQSNPLVLNYLTQNALWWIEYANLDGFRVDTYSYNDKEAIAKWTQNITNEYPDFNIVGEVWLHNQAQISYWQKNSPISKIQSYDSNLPSVMDFTLHDALGNVFNEDQPSWDQGMIKVYDNFVNDFLYENTNNLMTFVESHDTNRFNQNYKNNFEKYKMAMVLIATTRGIPQLYYGSEIGMAGDKGNGDAAIRQDFPGGWSGDNNNAFDPAGRTATQAKYYNFTSKLFQWRKTNPAVHFGKMTHYLPENNVYVYFRNTDKQTVMVVINNSADKQILKTNRFRESIKTFLNGKDVLTNTIINLDSDIQIAAKSAMVLELQ